MSPSRGLLLLLCAVNYLWPASDDSGIGLGVFGANEVPSCHRFCHFRLFWQSLFRRSRHFVCVGGFCESAVIIVDGVVVVAPSARVAAWWARNTKRLPRARPQAGPVSMTRTSLPLTRLQRRALQLLAHPQTTLPHHPRPRASPTRTAHYTTMGEILNGRSCNHSSHLRRRRA